MTPGTIIAIIKATLATINTARNKFPVIVQQQLDLAESDIKNAENGNELRFAMIELETAVNLISRSKWNSPLFFLGIEKRTNVEKYNSLCSRLSYNYGKLGNKQKASYWGNKLIDEYWNEPNDPDFEGVHIPTPVEMALGGL